MGEKIAAISVENIFTSENIYIIPIYQRNFAWKEKHILKLIEDINDNDSGYFLGNLTVFADKENRKFEIIDGQQRLTVLFMIYKALKMTINMTLDFQHRPNSRELLEGLGKDQGSEDWSKDIISGYDIVEETINKIGRVSDSQTRANFKEKLKKAQLLRIPVPSGTDLNHYFEIMNTRGVQLEKVDILKAKFMDALPSQDAKTEFASIWNVCSNMKEYVVKSLKPLGLADKYFSTEKNDIFAWDGDDKKLAESQEVPQNDMHPVNLVELNELLQDIEKNPLKENNHEDDQPVGHYESLVQFPEFLLHVLNIMKNNIDGQLDREKLLERFKAGKVDSGDFIKNLLKYRYFYDMYIGRRIEAEPDEDDNIEKGFGIRKLKQGKESVYTVNTFNEKNIKALQWALRITHTSQKSMQWITSALKFAAETHNEYDFEKRYLIHLENWITYKIKIDNEELSDNKIKTLSKESEIMNLGVGTPHIIFAYLDYLLQKNDPVEPSDYYYNFRTSVEHLYPQNDNEVPNGQTLQNSELLNNFGNLFLVNRETNSRFSNEPPRAKWERMAEGIPPKLEKAKVKHYPKWADNEILAHCEEMIERLKENL